MPDLDAEHRAEAERLALLPVEDQREVVALYRSVAGNPKVPKHERQAGIDRANALERLLKLARKSKKE